MLSFRRLMWLLLAAGSACSAFGAPKSAPNVVIITVDTLRADHLGCYGYKQLHTPNIDALAAAGARFQRAYTPVPVTLPAHTAIFTGTYPMYSGMHDFSANTLNSSQPTLASVLSSQGYATAAVIGSAVLDSRFGLNRGFDFYYDHFDFSRLQESNLDEMERPSNVVADTTLDWLNKKGTLELDSTNFSAAYNLGVAYLQKKMVPEATAAFRQSIAISLEYPLPHQALGVIFMRFSGATGPN